MKDSGHALPTMFFDLDGTLSDPSDGITRSIQHALKCLGRSYPDKSELVRFIGPPLRWTFPRLLETDDKDLVETAIRYYRQRYEDVGLFENEVYAGVPELLLRLHGGRYPLCVVTSKPTVYAERIIRHFGLDACFRGIFGPDLDGRFDDKTELVGHVLDTLAVRPERTVMIGDRAGDIVAGKAHGTRTIGVTYGFGSREEITAAEPDRICHSPHDIHEAAQVIGGWD